MLSLSSPLTSPPTFPPAPRTLSDSLVCLPAGSKEPPGHPEESARGRRAPPRWTRVHAGSQPCGALAVLPGPLGSCGPCLCYSYLWGAQHVTDPACWPDWRAPWLEFPDPCSSTGVPFASHPWMGYPPPAASGPSIWAWGICSFDPLMGSQPSVPCFSRVFPYSVEPPAPFSSVLPAPALGAPGPMPRWGVWGASTWPPGPPGCFVTLWSPHPHTPRPLQL